MNKVTLTSKAWGGDYEKFLAGAFERKRDAIGYPFSDELLILNNGVPDDLVFPFRTVSSSEAPDYLSVYAKGEVTAVFSTITKYICFVQGDCLTTGGDWVTPAIKVLESEPDVLSASPLSEVNTRGEYDLYCSDQAFVARTKDLQRTVVYLHREIDPDYPSYAPYSFEALVGGYMKATNKKRKILNDFFTYHPQY